MTSTNIIFKSIFLALVSLVLCSMPQKSHSCDRGISYDALASFDANSKELCYINYIDSESDKCNDKFSSGNNCKLASVNSSAPSPMSERIELGGFIDLSTNYTF